MDIPIRSRKKGLVYLLSDGERYKIGVTRGDVMKRIKKLQTGNASEIFLVSYYETDYPFYVEALMHFRHTGKNEIGNEWYSLCLEDVKSFKTDCMKIEGNISVLEENPFFKVTI